MSKKKHKQKQKCKRRKKVRLPVDRNGTPIDIGDWLMFDEGPIQVMSLTLCDHNDWFAGNESEDLAIDNLCGGVVLEV